MLLNKCVAKGDFLLYNKTMRKRTKEKNACGVISGQPSQTINLEASDVLKDFLDILRYQSKQKNNLFGNFSADGKYKIEDENILRELTLLPKKFEEKVDNVVYASSKLGTFVLNFKLVFEMSSSYCNASISLIEIEHTVEEDIKHVTFLDSIVEPYSPTFKEECYKQWKILFDFDEVVKNDYLFTYLHMQEEEFLFNKELTEILSQLYLVRMLKVLDNAGELGEKIKLQYKLIVEKLLAKDPTLAQNNTKLKEILDKILIKNDAFKELLKSKEAVLILANFSMPIKRVKEKSVPTILREGTKKPKEIVEEKKAEKKKQAKPKAKKKSKGGGGKIKPFVYNTSKAFGAKYSTYKSPTTPSFPKISQPTPSETSYRRPNTQERKPENVETEDENLEEILKFVDGQFNEVADKNQQDQFLSEENNKGIEITDKNNNNQSLLEEDEKVEDRIEDVSNILGGAPKLGEISSEKSQNVLGKGPKHFEEIVK